VTGTSGQRSSKALIERFVGARSDPEKVVLEGFHALKHALRFGADIEQACVADLDKLGTLARSLAPDLEARMRAITQPVSSSAFNALAPVPPATGVIAIARRPQVDLRRVLEGSGLAPVVLLEAPANLNNLGAVVRVAAAAGATAVLATGTHDPWHPSAVRAAAGLQFAIPVARVGQAPPTEGPMVAVDPEGEPLCPGAIPDQALLAFGAERHGLSRELLAAADRRLAIPMRPGVSSLNLASAVAVALYAWRFGQT
jgi:TrmH family RNA methyltransferase